MCSFYALTEQPRGLTEVKLNYPFASWVLPLLVNNVNNDCPWFGEVSALGLWCVCFKFSHQQTFEVVWVTFLLRLWWKLSSTVHLSFQNLRFSSISSYVSDQIGLLAYILFFFLMGPWQVWNLQSWTPEIQHLNLNVYASVTSTYISPKNHFLSVRNWTWKFNFKHQGSSIFVLRAWSAVFVVPKNNELCFQYIWSWSSSLLLSMCKLPLTIPEERLFPTFVPLANSKTTWVSSSVFFSVSDFLIAHLYPCIHRIVESSWWFWSGAMIMGLILFAF